MKRKLKNELTEYFEAPKPEKKQAFVRKYTMRKMNLSHIVAMQARYISKGVWIFSGLFFGITCLVAQIAEPGYVSMVLALIPFLVILSVTESVRSYRYGMEELELSTRFSLKSILLARMVMLGLGNFVILSAAMLLLKGTLQVRMVYWMAPYFLTAGGSLYIVRKLRGNESTFPCFALAASVCALELCLFMRADVFFAPKYAWVWIGACVIGVIMAVRESYRTIRMTEDLAWNW